ncbi:hypothetical protein [Actinophytocola xanthii]|uniref:Secreted protein n=1 Tax=Actinophytocola xanthii TaxID=1912961 RepID=A0A1Q8CJX2_9PSEU|nr:hypothetical protein [Actinophytocola xanthii]OLF14639.1 hypothetical protein BU204_26210 [Actinophytocola xanthii]
MSTGAIIALVIVVLAVLAVVGWFVSQRMHSRKLRDRFGPEYDRRVSETGDRRKAERELIEREKRHARLQLRPLPDGARERYAEQWGLVQEEFVDRPGDAVVGAEALVQTVMRERGYPIEEFEQQAEDLSVEHGTAVPHYRAAHEIRIKHERAEATTEELRTAMVEYRKIFVSLVGVDSEQQASHTADTEADRGESTSGNEDRRYDDAAR